MSGMRQKIQYSLALEPAHQSETPVGGCQGTEPVVAKPAPQSPALVPTSCRCPSLTPSNRRVRDPYARWCGRGGTARCPPIPIRGESRDPSSRTHRVSSNCNDLPTDEPFVEPTDRPRLSPGKREAEQERNSEVPREARPRKDARRNPADQSFLPSLGARTCGPV